MRKRKKKAIPVSCLKTLGALYELQLLGLSPSGTGLLKVIQGDEKHMAFSDLKMFGSLLSLRRKKLSGILTLLENHSLVIDIINYEEEEKYFRLTKQGEEEAKSFLDKYDKTKHIPRIKKAKKEFVPFE